MTPNQFKEACTKLGISLTEEQEQHLLRYYHLLVEWNEKINLTGITEQDQVYLKHFYDSLTLQQAADLYKVKTLCDIGTGAGFPGLVLKIVFPNLQVTLVDSLGKRIQFLNHVIADLELQGIEVVQARAEEYAQAHRNMYQIVTARAVAHLSILTEYSLPLVEIGGYFLPMKANLHDEVAMVEKVISILGGTIDSIVTFQLPMEESERNIVKIKKATATPSKYPRKYSDIKKHPLGG